MRYEYLGAGPETLKELVDGTNKFAAKLKRAKKPMIIIGQGALARGDGAGVLANAAKLADAVGAVKGDWNGFAVLHTAAARVGGLDLGFVPGEGGLDAADADRNRRSVPAGRGRTRLHQEDRGFTVYIGTHGDNGAHHADVILPAATYTEKVRRPTSTPKAACRWQPRRLRAGRGARRLGDPAGPVGRARQEAAL
jgi:NADH-quinone oxidoreductase subunit G